MSKACKSFIVAFVVLAFVATAVICCCVVKESFASLKKASCSHCTSKTQGNAKSHECCFSKASPMELAKLTGILNLSPLLVLAVFSLLYIRPMPRLAYSSIYKNGPPGFVSEIPLYYRSRSIRI